MITHEIIPVTSPWYPLALAHVLARKPKDLIAVPFEHWMQWHFSCLVRNPPPDTEASDGLTLVQESLATLIQ